MVKHNITVEDSSPLIYYTGNWLDSPNTDPDYDQYSGYASPDFRSFHSINNGTSGFDFLFNGSAVYVFGTMGPTGGTFDAFVKLQNPDLSDFVNGTNGPIGPTGGSSLHPQKTFQTLLYSNTNLNPGSYKPPLPNIPYPFLLRIINSGTGDFVLDYIVVESDVEDLSNDTSNSSIKSILLDETSPAVSLSGSWTDQIPFFEANTTITKYFNNNTQHYIDSAGSLATINFRGSGIEVHGAWHIGRGFYAKLDNYSAVQVTATSVGNNTNETPYRPRELLCAFDGLKDDSHVLTLTNAGGTSPGNTSPGFGTPVDPTLETITSNQLDIDFVIVTTSDPNNDGLVVPGSSSTSSLVSTSTSGIPLPSSSGGTDLFPQPPHSPPVGAIAGGVIGGVVLLVLLIVAFLFYRRRRRRTDALITPLEISQDGVGSYADPQHFQPYTYNPYDLATEDQAAMITEKQRTQYLILAAAAQTPSRPRSLSPSMAGTSKSQRDMYQGAQSMPQSSQEAATSSGSHLPPALTLDLPPVPARRTEVDAGVILMGSESPTRTEVTLPPTYDPAWVTRLVRAPGS